MIDNGSYVSCEYIKSTFIIHDMCVTWNDPSILALSSKSRNVVQPDTFKPLHTLSLSINMHVCECDRWRIAQSIPTRTMQCVSTSAILWYLQVWILMSNPHGHKPARSKEQPTIHSFIPPSTFTFLVNFSVLPTLFICPTPLNDQWSTLRHLRSCFSK